MSLFLDSYSIYQHSGSQIHRRYVVKILGCLRGIILTSILGSEISIAASRERVAVPSSGEE
jgi:hypothetical protein